MKKRGEFSTVANIVLLVIFAVLIIFAVSRFVSFMWSQSAESACTQSIVASGLDGVPKFDCKAERITISADKLEADADGELDSEGLDEAVKRAVANEMYACWKTTGRGMVDPYKNTYEGSTIGAGLTIGYYITTDVFLICKIVTFREVPSFEGLFFWMTMNKPQGADTPYFDTIYNRKPTDEEIEAFEDKNDSFDTSKTYVVAWRHTPYFVDTDTHDSIVLVPYSELIQGEFINYMGTGFSRELGEKVTGKYTPIVMN